MTGIIRSVLAPIRRPFAAWFHTQITLSVRKRSAEVSPGLDGLLRELTRLQDRIDTLETALAASRVEHRDSERARAG